MSALRRATGLALVLTYALIVLGAWVRATGSGLACPDWPTCYGHLLPLPGEIPSGAGYAYHQVMLEWAHRLLAGAILGPLILLIGWLAWRARRENPRLPAYASALITLLLIQAGLGGVSPAGWLASEVARVGQAAAQADDVAAASNQVQAQVQARRDSISGVNLNEELTNLLRYQYAFQAAARVINVADTVLGELVNLGR